MKSDEGTVVDEGREESLNPDAEQNEDYYRALRAKWETWMQERNWPHWLDDVVLFIPDFFYLLIKMISDPRVSAGSKVALGAGIAYYVWPLDFLPDALGPLGFIDDLIVAAYVLNRVFRDEGHEVAREHWPGDGDVIAAVQQVIAKADEMVGSGALSRLTDWIAKKTGSPRS